jgi:ribosome-binding protein aMBF1 (putative translation factor)
MNIQIINNKHNQEEYALLPIKLYRSLESQIKKAQLDDEFIAFNLDDFVTNPVANARIKKGLTQKQLAEKMQVSQAYISKLEHQPNVSHKILLKMQNI